MSERGLPPHVLTEIDSAIREARLTGVHELNRLVNGADLDVAAAARQVLERLAQDDSRSVASAAAVALARMAVRVQPERVDFGRVPPGTPHMVADVHLDGSPLAVASAEISVSGPGLKAMLTGRRLRIVWQPRSYWLDGLVTVRGPAGWADVRVTGQVAAGAPAPRTAVRARTPGEDRALRTVGAPPPPARGRRVRASVLLASLTVLVLLGGAGAAMALTRDRRVDRQPAVALPVPAPAVASPAPPPPTAVSRVPLARQVQSLGKPSVLTTIAVGAEPEGVVVAPDGRTVYVANQHSRILSVVDTAGRRVTAVPLRDTPRFVATSRDGRLVFVSMYEDDKSGSGVAVVDATSRKVLRYLTTGVQPYALAVGPDDRVWVPIHSSGRVEIYATTGTQQPDGRIKVPANPHAVAFSAPLMRAFTPDHESNALSIIDLRTDRLLKSVPVSQAPHSVAVSPDGRTVLVAGYDADTADLIDAQTLRRTGPFPVGSKPQSVAFATDGTHAYVVNEGDNTITVLDAHTAAVTATVKVGRSPRTIAVAPDGRLAYVSNGDDDTITVLTVGR